MTLKTIRIGDAVDVYQYDNGSYPSAIETTEPIRAGSPVASNDVVRLGDLAGQIFNVVFPIGVVFCTVLSTNPSTLLGFGTWAKISEGQLLAGYKSGDANFGTLEGTGGALTHAHNVDVPNTTSAATGTYVSVDRNLDGAQITVGDRYHTHDVDPGNFTSGSTGHLPPYFTINVWKRTA